MNTVKLNTLKKTDFFKRNETSNTVYVRGLCRQVKRGVSWFNCYKADDCNSELVLKGDTQVFIDFEY